MTQVTIPPALGGDGLPFSDDGTSARDMQGQGYATNFFPMVAQTMAALQTGVQAAGAIATGSTNTTSSTSLTISTGSKSLTVETGKALVPGMWVLLAYRADPAKNMTGQVTSYAAATGALVLNVTGTSGAGTYTDWSGSVTGAPAAVPSITRAVNTSAYKLTSADKGALIDCSGTWTLDLTAAATLGAGWWCYVRNIGTGTITADPNASELIDGVTSGAIRPGMTLLVQCDGTAFHCVRVGPHVAMGVLTSGTSWTCPLGVRTVRARISGPGGNGAFGSYFASGGGGGGTWETLATTTPGAAYAYAIGAAPGGVSSMTIGGATHYGNSGSNASGTNPGYGGTASGANGVELQGIPGSTSQYNSGIGMGGCAVTGFGRGGNANTNVNGGLPTNGAIILEY